MRLVVNEFFCVDFIPENALDMEACDNIFKHVYGIKTMVLDDARVEYPIGTELNWQQYYMACYNQFNYIPKRIAPITKEQPERFEELWNNRLMTHPDSTLRSYRNATEEELYIHFLLRYMTSKNFASLAAQMTSEFRKAKIDILLCS